VHLLIVANNKIPLERRTTAYSAPAWDGVVTSCQQGASPPSFPAMCGHPRLCAATPSTAASSPALWKPGTTGHHRTRRCTSSDPPSAQPSSGRTDGDQTRSSRATTLEAAPGQSQDSPRRLPEARFSRTTINSTTLCAMPPYVALESCDMTVNRLPFPLAYKRRRRSPSQEGRRIAAHLHISAFIHDIGTLPQSNLRDLEASPPLPPCL
jgi:hypothetical protein